MAFELRKAADSERPTVEHLIQLYLYDMASEHPWPLGPDGRYGYDFLDRFWQYPYLLYADGELAGFALLIRGCPVTGRDDCWFMAEFFVLRPYRRRGLGAEATRRLLASWGVACGGPAVQPVGNGVMGQGSVRTHPGSHADDVRWQRLAGTRVSFMNAPSGSVLDPVRTVREAGWRASAPLQ